MTLRSSRLYRLALLTMTLKSWSLTGWPLHCRERFALGPIAANVLRKRVSCSAVSAGSSSGGPMTAYRPTPKRGF
ncbi:MAG: hypothetical protein JWL70_3162 [Acidimicrobiia bacterium]|nr:hypothetical protein [Acidimicrobiia bacterium]